MIISLSYIFKSNFNTNNPNENKFDFKILNWIKCNYFKLSLWNKNKYNSGEIY